MHIKNDLKSSTIIEIHSVSGMLAREDERGGDYLWGSVIHVGNFYCDNVLHLCIVVFIIYIS